MHITGTGLEPHSRIALAHSADSLDPAASTVRSLVDHAQEQLRVGEVGGAVADLVQGTTLLERSATAIRDVDVRGNVDPNLYAAHLSFSGNVGFLGASVRLPAGTLRKVTSSKNFGSNTDPHRVDLYVGVVGSLVTNAHESVSHSG